MYKKEEIALVSLLLRYPTEEIINEIKDLHTENPYIKDFLNSLKNKELMDLQQEYVRSFDLNDKSSLYLTYHRFRDDPKRGNYLSKLINYYRDKGYYFVENELPDFLPVVLEFIYHQPVEIGIEILKNFEKEINQIQKGLTEINSAYLPLIDFILHLIKTEVNV